MTWMEIRCPLCGFLHNEKKWQGFRVTDYDVRDWGIRRASTGRNFVNKGKISIDDVPLGILKQIRDRTLKVLGFLYQKNLITDENISAAKRGVVEEKQLNLETVGGPRNVGGKGGIDSLFKDENGATENGFMDSSSDRDDDLSI